MLQNASNMPSTPDIVNYALNYASIIRQTQPYGKCLLVVVLMQVKSGLRLKKCPV